MDPPCPRGGRRGVTGHICIGCVLLGQTSTKPTTAPELLAVALGKKSSRAGLGWDLGGLSPGRCQAHSGCWQHSVPLVTGQRAPFPRWLKPGNVFFTAEL